MPRGWLCIIAVMILGCQPASPGKPLSRHSDLNDDAVRSILSQRAKMIHTMTGRCELTLRRRDQQVVQLDGVMVMAPPDRVRLRAWKVDQAVFDLTVLPEGAWIETAPQSGDTAAHEPIVPATVSTARLSRQLSWLIGGFFLSPGPKQETSHDRELLYLRDEPDGTSIVCEVDAATATARQFTMRDSAGKTRFSLEMSDYRDVDGIAWPMRLAARDLGGFGEIDIAFSSVEFNAELAPRAFVPPPGAEKQP